MNNNVYLAGCHSQSNQQWVLDSNSRLKTLHANDKCLDWSSVGNNLYMHTCHTNDNQRFVVPSEWLPHIEEGNTGDGLEPLELPSTYSVRPLQKGVWENDVCTIDLLRDVMDTCDESISLLLGNDASIGTLRDIAALVEDVGPDRMPGRCCLDSPTNSEWFGTNVSSDLAEDGHCCNHHLDMRIQ